MTSSQPSDIERLSAAFPSWTFGSTWVTAPTGPDRRRVWASRGDVFVSAWDADGVAVSIRQQEAAHQAVTGCSPGCPCPDHGGSAR